MEKKTKNQFRAVCTAKSHFYKHKFTYVYIHGHVHVCIRTEKDGEGCTPNSSLGTSKEVVWGGDFLHASVLLDFCKHKTCSGYEDWLLYCLPDSLPQKGCRFLEHLLVTSPQHLYWTRIKLLTASQNTPVVLHLPFMSCPLSSCPPRQRSWRPPRAVSWSHGYFSLGTELCEGKAWPLRQALLVASQGLA